MEELALSGDKPECCGYGGLVFNANPKLAADVVGHRVSSASSADAAAPTKPIGGWFRAQRLQGRDTRYYQTEVAERDYIAYCAMCRDRLADAGKRVSHLIEQVFPVAEGADPAARGWISWTERRRNRARVRREILRELGETVDEGAEMGEGIVLQMTPEVRRRVDERRILEDDIAAVIEHAEQTGQRLRNETTGQYRAYRQLENVTFWVDYSLSDDGFAVHNAYCHRMKIVGVMT